MANDLHGKTGWIRTAASVVLFLCLSASGLWAQLTLSPPIPSQGQAGATVISINGSNFPGGSVASANITLQPTAGGPSTTTAALSVTALAGTTSRVTFLIPKSIVVTTPTPYKISITGSTTDGIFFVSINTVSLTLNPAGSVVFSPNSSKAGSSLDVNIVGNFTTFVQGATMANFGPGISVENGPLGSATLIKVTSLTTATAHIGIDTSAATGIRTVIVNTGAQKASATFNVLPQDVVPTPTDPSPPTANAGPQQLVLLGSTVHLDGSGSLSGGGGELSFAWSFISRPSGSNAGISNPAAVNPTFIADKSGDYVLQLKVTEGAKSSSASVVITTQNTAPVAEAGPSQLISIGSTVQLDGSASSDADGDPLGYQWEIVSRPAGSSAALSDPASVLPTFVADLPGTYGIQLVVNDGHNHTSTDSVSVSTLNAAPVANAGSPQTVNVGAIVQLDGSHSSDPDSDTLTFAWSLTSRPNGSQATMQSSSTANPTFTVDVFGTYVAQLTVSDGHGHSASATVAIDTLNSPPVARAGTAQTVPVRSTVSLDGSGSYDPDGQTLSFTWSLTSKPAGSFAALSASNIARPTFTADLPGPYVAQLVVSDGTFTSAPATVLITATAPGFFAEPASLNFGNQNVNSVSASQAVVITNTGNGPLTINALTVSGNEPGSFKFTAPALPVTIASAKTVTVLVTFQPQFAGSQSAYLEFADNTDGSPHLVSLFGKGIAPVIGYSPGSLFFDVQAANTTSAAKTIVITNSGTSNLVIPSLDLGGSNAADFAVSSSSLPITVTPGSNTSVSVTFSPKGIDMRSATLAINSNAAGSPAIINLSGVGSGSQITVQPLQVDFGEQVLSTQPKTQPVVITNNGNAALVVSGLAIQGTQSGNFSFSSQTLPLTVPPGASTSISVNFVPQTAGPQVATLAITDNSVSGAEVVSLAGTALAPQISYSPGSITFANQAVGTTSSASSVHIANIGTSDLVITEIAFSGANPGDFISTTVLPVTVSASHSVDIGVAFKPSAAGSRSSSLVFSSNSSGSPNVVGLIGTGSAPAVGFAPASLNFADQPLNTPSAQKSITVTNTGTSQLVISSVALSGPCAAQFAVTIGVLPITLPPSTSANISVAFTPVELSSCTASLNFVTNATDNPLPVSLSGNGSGAPSLSVNPLSVSFGNQRLNVASAASIATLTNASTQPLTISSITITGANPVDFTLTSAILPLTLAPNQSTAVNIVFMPVALGSRLATLSITHNGTGTPRLVPLSGTGVLPAVSLAPAALSFGNQQIGSTSAPRTLVVSNVGTADLVISSLALSPATTEFKIVSGAAPITIPSGGSANIDVTFTPGAAATYATQLVLTDNAAGSPRSIPLSGTGASALIGIVPSMVEFGGQALNTTSSPATITVSNPGTVNLVISNISFTGANSSDYTFTAPSLPITLAPGANAVLNASFKPTAAGSRLAGLVLTDNASGSPHVITLSGTGSANGTTVSIFPTSVAFGKQTIDTASSAKSVIVSNTGGSNLIVSSLLFTGDAAADFSHGAVLPMLLGPGSSTSIPLIFRPSGLGTRSASLKIISDGAGSPHIVDLSGIGAGAPILSAAPQSIAFGSYNVGTSGPSRQVVVSNTGTDALVISSITVFGFNQASDFIVNSAALPITVAPGANTTLDIVFKPGAEGPRAATLSMQDNAVGSPHTVSLAGTGTVPSINILPLNLIFGSQAMNGTSNPRGVTISNPGTGPLTITSLTFSGAGAADFNLLSTPPPITVQPGASTTLNFTFTPSVTGSRNSTVTLAHNAGTGSSTFSLSGTGIVPGPAINLSPATLNFGAQQVNTTSSSSLLSVENPGTDNLVITSLQMGGANAGDFTYSGTALPITVIPGGSALINVAFTPSASGPRSASLNLVDNATGSPHQVALSGTGVSPTIGVAPATIDFGTQTVNIPTAAQTVTLSNTGAGPLVVSNLSIIGSESSDFSLSAGSLPITVAPGGNTRINVVFTAKSVGSRSAMLVISDNAVGTPHSVVLSGSGKGTGAIISVTPLSLSFSSQALNTTSPTQPVLVFNQGNANLTITGSSLSGANASDFSFTAGTFPASIPPGSSIVVLVKFAPSAVGLRSAVLNFSSDADSGPNAVALSGTGFSAGPAINTSPQSVSFGNQPVNVASAAAPLTISNTGTAGLVISSLTLSGANAADFTVNASLPLTIAPGTSAAIGITFRPSAGGDRAASLLIADNATGSPHAIPLSGSGTLPIISINPGSLNFGNQPALTISNPTPLVISNTGSAPLVVTSLSVLPATAIQFQISTLGLPLTIAPGSSATVNVIFAPTSNQSYSGTLSIAHNAGGSTSTVPLSGTGTLVGIGLSPSSVAFGNQQLNVTSQASEVVISNTGSAVLTLSNLTITGTHAADYAVTAFTLPVTIQPGASTVVNVVFTPKALGLRTAILAITDNASGSPHSLALSGTGVGVAGISIDPTAVAFGGQALSAASAPQTVTVTNTGSSNLVISNLALTGTQASEFAFGSTTLPITVLPGASTSITLTFTPLGLGTRTATLSLTDNVSGSPHTVTLSGSGVGAPAVTLAPTSILFSNQPVNNPSAPSPVTVTNTGTGNLVISAIAVSGANPSEFGFTTTTPLPITVAPSASTTINVTFTPSVPGTRSAILNITDNAVGSTRSVPLSGTGSSPAIAVTPPTINLGNQTVLTVSPAQQVVISNTGSAPLIVSSLALTGANASEFAVSAGTLPLNIAPGSSSTVDVTFSPTGSGSRAATLTISHNANSPAQVVALSGTGTVPVIGISAGTLNFGNQSVSVASTPVNLTVNNSGNGTLIISAIGTSGANPGDFAYSGSLPVTIAPGTGKSLAFIFTPSQPGARSATLVLTNNAAGSPHIITLSGNGVAPAVNVTPGSIPFGSQAINTMSAPASIVVTNTGTASLILNSLTLTGANPGDFSLGSISLPATIAPNQSATLTVRFSPSASGARSATLNINHNGGVSTVALSGTGAQIPGFSISPNSVSFGSQLVNSSTQPVPITISNSGTASLVVSGLSITGANALEFSATSAPLPVTIAPGSSTVINAVFSPTALGSRTALLNIADNATGSPHTVALTGTGIGQAVFGTNPSSANFGVQLAGTTTTITLNVANGGTDTLTVSAVTISGTNAADFAISGNLALPLSIAPGTSAPVTIAFTPSAAGSRSATLKFTDNAAGSPHSVSLAGIGGAPTLDLNPLNLNFGGQQLNTTSPSKTFTITNSGTTPLFISSYSIAGANASEFVVNFGTLPATIPAGGNLVVGVTFAPQALGARSAALTIMNNAAGNPHVVPLTGTGVGAVIGFSSTTLNFPGQPINSTGQLPLTITNSGTGDLVITAIAKQGTNAAEFSVNATLPITMPPGGNITLQVSFTPTSTGSRSANLSISDNAPGGPHTITLLGTATAPGINLFPSPLTFGNQNVGIASNPVVLTANNTGTADLIISALSFSGANASEFALSGVTLPITVPPGQSRGINVTFTPSAQGQRAGVLNLTDNAGGSPHTVNLSGNGTQPAINLNVTSLAFGDQALNNSSAAKPVVVTNPGSGPLIISALAISGGNAADFTVTSGTLPITVEPSSTLVINVIFNPKATGPRSSALILTHNAPGSPNSISLSGNGTQPVINLSVPSIAFNIQDVNTTSAASVVTASNTGTGSLIISGLSITGLNPGDFSITSPPLPISIAPGASADIQIAFTPKATGARAASLSITHNAIGSPNSIPLSGTGRGPVISINPLSVTFANRNLNTTSPASTVSIGNTGNGDLIISSLSISGTNAAEFAVASAGLPLTINPGGSALVSVTFTPTTAGLRSASLNVGTNAPGSPNAVALSGTGIGPAVLVNPTALDFGSLAVNTTSNPTQVTVSNSGNTDLVISNIALTGANTADFAFTAAARPITITAGGNTTINVTFTPKQVGVRTASLIITDNATGSPHTATLQGTGSGTAQVSMQSVTVGSNLQVLATASITSVPSSDVPVTITSADPTRVLLLNALTDSGGVGAGSSSITMTVKAGTTTIFPGFWVQGLASSGSVLLNLSAPGYASSTATVSLSRAGFVLLSPQGQGADFTANSAAQDVTLNVIPALLDSSSNVVAGVSTRIRGGFSTSVAVTSQNSSVGDITDSPAAFSGGSTSSVVHFTAAGTGSTLLKLTMPPGFNLPTGGSQLTATVVLPKITLNQTSVGANLQVEGAGILDAAAPSGGLAVTITSSNPSVVKLSASPTDAGATSIVLNVPVGQSFLPLFFVQAVGTAGSSAQITATATKYQTGTAPVSVTASGFVISGPSGNAGQSFSTSTISRSTELKITPVQLSTTLNVLNTGQIRGGLSVSVPVNNGNSAAGSVVSANANFGPGDLLNNNLVAFSPLAQGNALISLGTPSVAGFTTPNAGASLTISVTQPQITIALPATTIGKDLQVLGAGTLSAPAQSGGLDITIRVSSGSGVLLSTTPTGVGSTSIVVNVPQGSTGGGSFPSYFVQSTASSGSAVITAQADGWQSSSVNLTLKPSGLVLRGPNGLGQAFGTLASFGDIPLTIETWQINDATLLPERAQDLRGGLALSIDVPSSNPSVATLIGSPAGFTGGSSNTTVAFHPVGKGETIVSFSEPAGFSTPSSGGKALNSITADVN